ncbi:MAG TPA: GldG family protein [Gammaproteobacteria bacterium]
MKIRIEARTRARVHSLLTGALIILLATLLGWLSTRHYSQWDWTAAGRHSLSDASTSVLRQFDGKVEITAYAREQPELRDMLQRFVDRYRRVRPDIALLFVNPDAVPDEVRNLGVSVNGELVLRYENRVEHVRVLSEQEFTNALQRLLRSRERWLAFVEGHGERSVLGQGNHDFGHFAQQLRQRGFRLQPLNLAETRTVPDNTAVLVLAGSRMPFLPGELQLVLEYLQRGGSLLWLSDPGGPPGFEPLAAVLGIELPPGTVIDLAGQLLGINDPTVALVTTSLYGEHPVLSGFAYSTIYPAAGAIVTGTGDGWRAQPLLTTGTHTWLETGPLSGEVGLDKGADVEGPLTLGVALERDVERKEGGEARAPQRAVVIADGDFLSNTYIGNTGNLELGLRLVNWLSFEDDMISIPARTAGDTQLEIDSILLGMSGIFFLIVLPLALLLTGLGIWWRRSRL